MLLNNIEYNPGVFMENEEKIKVEKIKKLEKQLAQLKRAA
jgi:hypothetical protein